MARGWVAANSYFTPVCLGSGGRGKIDSEWVLALRIAHRQAAQTEGDGGLERVRRHETKALSRDERCEG